MLRRLTAAAHHDEELVLWDPFCGSGVTWFLRLDGFREMRKSLAEIYHDLHNMYIYIIYIYIYIYIYRSIDTHNMIIIYIYMIYHESMIYIDSLKRLHGDIVAADY